MQPSNSSPNESVSQISSNESVKILAPSKIPKLNKLHVFKKSLNRNFNSMKKLSKIPIRLTIINKPIEQQQQKKIKYEQNVQKKSKIQNKKVLLTTKQNSNIKFKKIIKPCNNLQQKKQVNNNIKKKHIIRSETFDKKNESIKVLVETNDTTQIEINKEETAEL